MTRHLRERDSISPVSPDSGEMLNSLGLTDNKMAKKTGSQESIGEAENNTETVFCLAFEEGHGACTLTEKCLL